jgi:MFS family permease
VAADLDLSPAGVPPAGREPAGEPLSPASGSLLPLYAAHVMVHVLIGIYPAVLLLLRETFDVDYATLGAVFAAATFLYGVGSIPTGFIVNRVHPLTIIRCYLALAVVAATVIAAAPSDIAFAAGLLLLGLAGSPYHTAAMTLISRASGNSPRLLAHHGMAGSLGLAIAPAFGALLAAVASWRLPFAIAGGITAVVLVSTLAVPRLENRRSGLPQQRTTVQHGSTHLGALLLVYVITMALGFVFRGFGTFLPALATERADVFPGNGLIRGGLLASLVYAVGFFGQWWAVRLGHHRELEGIYSLLLGAQAVLLALIVPFTDWALVVVLLIFSVAHFTCQPLENVLTGKYTSLERRGIGFGFSFGISFGMGSFAAWAGGVVADTSGGQLQYVYLMLAGAALIGSLCGLALWILARRIRNQPVPAPAAAGAAPEPPLEAAGLPAGAASGSSVAGAPSEPPATGAASAGAACALDDPLQLAALPPTAAAPAGGEPSQAPPAVTGPADEPLDRPFPGVPGR